MFPPTGTPSRKLQFPFLALLITLLTIASTGCNLMNSPAHGSQSPLVSVAVTPGTLTVHAGQTAQFEATVTGGGNAGVTWRLSSHAPQLGSINRAGLYTAPAGLSQPIQVSVVVASIADPARVAVASVTVTPDSPHVSVYPQAASVQAGGTQQFGASVTGMSNSAVTWSLSSSAAQSGSISSTGLYTAPSNLSGSIQVMVTATSVAEPGVTASAGLTVNAVSAVHVSVTPHSGFLQAGGTQQFSATVFGTNNTAVSWSLSSNGAQPGSISSAGLYTAPPSVSSSLQVMVIATSVADPAQSASAALQVNPVAAVHVSVTPQSGTAQAGGTQQFSAVVTGTSNSNVTWSLSSTASQPGSISSSGFYTAPATVSSTMQVTVTATSVADTGQSASAFLTVNPIATVHVSVTPQSGIAQAGSTQQFASIVTGTNNSNVTWSLSSTASQPGSISSSGLYTAPSTLSAVIHVTVTATSVADPSKSASASLTVNPLAAVHVSVTPQSATVASGATQQLSANVTGTSNTAVVWSMSSQAPQYGKVSSSGLYTAPLGNTGDVQVSVIATSVADATQSASAAITVLPASSVSVKISPSSFTMLSGSARQFVATVTGTSNTAVTWSASLGSVSSGLYTAPVTSVQETATLTATSVADSAQKASATVTVTPQASAGPGLQPSFFGLHVNQLSSPWPTVPFASYRSLNSSYIKWADINTGDQTYNWTNFDRWMARAESNGQDIMYTLFTTPSWASSRGVNTGNPNNSCVYANITGPGACDPPNDLNADGTGSDKHWKDFITAVMTHVGPGKIKYWEVWNEYNNSIEWTGTQEQMLRMAKDAYTIIKAMDSNALVTTPSVSSPMFAVNNWVKPYLQAGGGNYADVIAIHGYVHLNNTCPGSCPDPQIIASILDNVRAVMAATGQQNKPLFDTEGSWGEGTQMNDPDMQTAFTGRYFLLQGAGTATSKGFDKFYWYGWDFRHSGQFYAATSRGLTQSGSAYQQLYNWMVGATMTGCSAHGTQWTCPMTRTGYQAEAIWDSSHTCSNGNCSTSNVTVAPVYVQYRDLSGNVTVINNNTVPVGLKPLLLESGNAP